MRTKEEKALGALAEAIECWLERTTPYHGESITEQLECVSTATFERVAARAERGTLWLN